jgi:hypothetical protein
MTAVALSVSCSLNHMWCDAGSLQCVRKPWAARLSSARVSWSVATRATVKASLPWQGATVDLVSWPATRREAAVCLGFAAI